MILSVTLSSFPFAVLGMTKARRARAASAIQAVAPSLGVEVNPINVYGSSKLEGEIQVAEANPRHTIVRTSWLFGMHGRNFVDTMLTLAAEQNEVMQKFSADSSAAASGTTNLGALLKAKLNQQG